MTEAPWKWFAGSNDEHFTIGPCDTREEALLIAQDVDWPVIHLVEARQDPIDMSKMIDAGDILERWLEDDQTLHNENGDCSVSVTPEQEKDLSEMLVMAVRHWQVKHDLKPVRYYFSAQRNEEIIVQPEREYPEGDPENTEGTY